MSAIISSNSMLIPKRNSEEAGYPLAFTVVPKDESLAIDEGEAVAQCTTIATQRTLFIHFGTVAAHARQT